ISAADSDTVVYSNEPGSSIDDQLFTRSLHAGPAGQATQITSDAANHTMPSFSRDGTKVLYEVTSSVGGQWQVKTLGGATASLPNPNNLLLIAGALNSDASQVGFEGVDVAGTNLPSIFTQPTSGSSPPTAIKSNDLDIDLALGMYWTSSNGRAPYAGGMSSVSRDLRHILRNLLPHYRKPPMRAPLLKRHK
ncbi:MAG TPA: hypothetical protein VG944_18835, partial [Fimbriimonas sp.]|nr:hypothetical protein [Fimbriimonas sp.]